MAMFVKKDGSIIEPKEQIRLPAATEGGLVGIVENFEVDYDHSTDIRRIRMSLAVLEEDLIRAGGMSPNIATGAKVEIRQVR